ncbi:MAG: hypothetical protein SCALA702_36410 [Melioribacteraceae bacterium]|nr:MAG: hypothetical protein SCALA702_36410 [Melioribacteraceae bacterium]
MNFKAVIFFLVLIAVGLSAQSVKKIEAVKASLSPVVNGYPDDAIWNNIPAAKNFVQYEPSNGKSATFDTEVKFAYNDEALFILAKMYENNSDSIWQDMGRRDEIYPQADMIGIMINPFDDGRNAYEFRVSAAGVQTDCKNTSDYLDPNWDAIWESSISFTDNIWYVEMEIPYSALRFPERPVQNWRINVTRTIKRLKEETTWNFVDITKDGRIKQSGYLTGIKNIEPPTRLSFMPYFSGYVDKNPDNSVTRSFNGGLDVKYGINESFTLDMMLIPDFGQVESDDTELNLSYVETRYEEKRQFFTEGAELFGKAGIFYSRRIGSVPADYYSVYNDLAQNEVITDNPSETQIINAAKVSGRTNSGLGIGFFNAVTLNTYAEIKNSATGSDREVLTQPATNYNIIVLDQSFDDNKFISLINTNLYRPGTGYMANVTGSEFRWADGGQNYQVFGTGAVSNKFNTDYETDPGFYYDLSLSKISGNFRFTFGQSSYSDKYDPNDMGYLGRNNSFSLLAQTEYILWDFNDFIQTWVSGVRYTRNSLYAPRKYSNSEVYMYTDFTFRSRNYFRIDFSFKPEEAYDYFEPRVWGKKYREPIDYYIGSGFGTNPLARNTLYLHAGYWHAMEMNKEAYWLNIHPKVKVNNNLEFAYFFDFQFLKHATGFAGITGEDVIFGRRDITTFTNTLEGRYNITAALSMNLRVRHYLSAVEYSEYYLLLDDGNFQSGVDFSGNDINYNTFNIDMILRWNFLPGSEMSLLWKNITQTYDTIVDRNYFRNFRNTVEAPQFNSLSLKVLYYLDYKSII